VDDVAERAGGTERSGHATKPELIHLGPWQTCSG
jgi:hypothetical protein